MRNGRVFRLVFVSLVFLLLNLSLAYAYLDPGSGSMLLQVFIGGIITVGIMIKSKWYRIKKFFLRHSKKNQDE